MTAWLRLFHRVIIRPLFRERLRTALTLFAVALGVGVVVAIDLAGVAATGSFRSSLQSLAGDADLELTAIGGLDERVLGRLVTLPYPLQFTPRLEGFAVIADTGASVTVVGLDLVTHDPLGDWSKDSFKDLLDQSSVWIGREFGRKPGEKLRLTFGDRTGEYIVRGTLRDDVIVMDVGTAQKALRKEGRLDRIEVLIPPGTPMERWEKVLRDALPGEVTVRPAGAATDENRKMLAAFRWNLRVLSYISLVVGAFLIYNTISVSVVRRRVEIGILRALGATRGQVMAAFLAEALSFGLVGALAGLAMGRVMAVGAVQLLAATVKSLYLSSNPAPIALSAGSLLEALGIGVGVALASAFAPAREASLVAPVEAMARGRRDYETRIHTRRDMAIALGLGFAAALASKMPPLETKPVFGYLAALLLIAASALATPATVVGVTKLWRHGIRHVLGVEAMLASRSLVASLSRTAVLVGALSTAVAMMASVGIMVGSFRQTVALWLNSQLSADLYLRPAGGGGANKHPTLAPEVADAVEAVSGVAAVDRFRVYDISYQGWPALLGAGQSEVITRFGKTSFLPGEDRRAILTKLPTGDYAIVSEPFANKHRVRAGDTILLPLGERQRPFQVLGVYYDYSNERGYIILDRKVLRKYLRDTGPSSLAVYTVPAARVEEVRRAVEKVCAGRDILIFSNRGLRVEAMRIFDRTFAITYALEAVAIVVAVMGIAGALLAVVIDRRRELGLLRFLGASGGQVRRLILFEAGLLGLLANLVGLALGVLLSLILIFVINKQSFGWTIQFHWPVALLLGALTLIYAATVVAGLYPARIGVRLNPIEVIHEE